MSVLGPFCPLLDPPLKWLKHRGKKDTYFRLRVNIHSNVVSLVWAHTNRLGYKRDRYRYFIPTPPLAKFLSCQCCTVFYPATPHKRIPTNWRDTIPRRQSSSSRLRANKILCNIVCPLSSTFEKIKSTINRTYLPAWTWNWKHHKVFEQIWYGLLYTCQLFQQTSCSSL